MGAGLRRATPRSGGGYVLDGSATLPPGSLTETQAVAVALAAQADAPYAVDGRAAWEKVLEVMDPRRPKAGRAAGRPDPGGHARGPAYRPYCCLVVLRQRGRELQVHAVRIAE